LNAELDPTFEPNVAPLRPAYEGALVFLEGYADTDAAHAWMMAFLVRVNKLQPDFYLICVPLPGQLQAQETKVE
jgi:hypothetical protein